MPVIEHIEIAAGGVPFTRATNRIRIFVVTRGEGTPNKVLKYTAGNMSVLANALNSQDPLAFIPLAGASDRRNIVHKRNPHGPDAMEFEFQPADNFPARTLRKVKRAAAVAKKKAAGRSKRKK